MEMSDRSRVWKKYSFAIAGWRMCPLVWERESQSSVHVPERVMRPLKSVSASFSVVRHSGGRVTAERAGLDTATERVNDPA